MKKLICVILSVVLMSQMLFVTASDVILTYDTDPEILAQKLIATEIISSVTHEMDDLVTRGEFASAVAKLFNVTTASGEQIFCDVDHTNADFGAVYSLYKAGAISVPEDKLFNPHANITCSEAAKILVCMLGYSAKAEASGGYPGGYLSVASGLKITLDSYRDGLSYYGMLVAFEDVAVVKVPVMDYLKDGYVSYETKEGVTVLSEYHDIYEEEGVVETVGINSLYGNESLTADKAVIGGITYYNDFENLYDYIGCDVTYYYKETDNRKTVVYAELNDENAILDIDAENIIDFTGSTYRYYTEKGKSDTAKVLSVPFVLYNGKTATGKNKNMYTPEIGNVRLVDSDSNGIYDVIIIKDYRIIVVEAVDAYNKIIYGKGGADDTLCFDDSLGIDARVTTASGKDVFAGVIAEWSIVSALVSEDKSYVRAIVSTESKDGKITGISDEDDGVIVSVDGQDYYVSEALKAEDIPALGTQTTCYMDFAGRIAAFNTYESQEYSYHVMIDYIKSPGLEQSVMIRVLNGNNEIKEYTLSKNAKIDGIRYKSASEQYDALKTGIDIGYIVRIKLEEEEVIDIDTPAISEKEYPESSISPYMEKTDDLLYKNSGNVEDTFYIADSTFIVFEYPGLGDDERFLVANRKMLSNDTRYTVSAFAIGETFVPQAAIFEFSSASGTVSSNAVYVVADKRKAADPTGNVENKLVLKNGTSTVEVFVEDEHINKLGGIDVGDIIRYDAYKEKYVLSDFIRKVYDYGDDKVTDTGLLTAGTNASAAVRLGYVYNKVDSHISYAAVDNLEGIDKAGKIVTVIPANILKITKERDKVEVKNGSGVDVKDYKAYGTNCARIFIKYQYRVPTELIVIEHGEEQE